MGRGRTWFRRRAPGADVPALPRPTQADWYEDVVRLARAQGALPYVVEGYVEINEAVRRGHAVLLKRERAQVADGVIVFDDLSADAGSSPATTPPPLAAMEPAVLRPLVTVASFDVRSARYVLQDGASAVGSIQLTPKRLARYVAEPRRAVGVALGA